MRGKKRSKARGGRPPKFDEPRRVVTVTLPERILRQLSAIQPDLARAIVQVTQTSIVGRIARRPPVELVEVAPGTSVILVGPSRCLRQLPWLRLIEIAPDRYLLTIVPGTAVESLEVAILDLLESVPEEDEYERAILTELRHQIGILRRKRVIWKAELLFVGSEDRRFPE